LSNAPQTRDHTERMLKAFRRGNQCDAARRWCERDYAHRTTGTEAGRGGMWPRDPSSGGVSPGGRVCSFQDRKFSLPGVMLNPRRIGLITTLLEMGADIVVANKPRNPAAMSSGDFARAGFPRLKGVDVPAETRAHHDRRISDPGGCRGLRRRAHDHARAGRNFGSRESDRLAAIIAGFAGPAVRASRKPKDGHDRRGGTGPDGIRGGGTIATHMESPHRDEFFW